MSCLDNIKNSDFRGYPSIVYELTKSEYFNKECSTGYEGSRHLYSKTYSSNISEDHLEYLVWNDRVAFNTAGQAHANAQGTCAIQRNTVPDPPLYLQAVDANNFYISSLEPFSRAEFTSSNPLPTKYLRNNNLEPLNYKSYYPHENSNNLALAAPVIDYEKKEFTNEFTTLKYDSSIHTPTSYLYSSTTSTPTASKYSVNGLSDSISFNNQEFVVTGIDDVREANMVAAKYALFGYGGAGLTILMVSANSYKLWVTLGLGALGWGLLTVTVAIAAIIAMFNSYKGSFVRHMFRSDGWDKYMVLYEKEVLMATATIQHQLTDVKTFYDDVSNRIYTLYFSKRLDKNWLRGGRSITSIEYDHSATPPYVLNSVQTDEATEFVSYGLRSPVVINTSQRSGFLWGRHFPGGSKDFESRMVRGTFISNPPSNIFNAEWASFGLITNTVKDSTNPSVCYISLYRPDDSEFGSINRVISYNGSTNSWALIRKLDSY